MKLTFTLIALYLSVLLNAQKAGTLDSSFGVNGEVVTSFNNASVTVYKGLIQPDNKVIAVGKSESTLPAYNGFIAIRYMQDGSIDSSFGDSGTTIISDPYEILTPSSACLQNDGKILIAGHGVVGLFPPIYTGVIVRLNVDGSIDSSFGKKDFVYTRNTSYSNITIQQDGKIICIGTNGTQFVSRLLENGSTDMSFGTNGYVFYSNYIFETCIVQPDGKIVIGGGYSSALPEQFLLKRLQPDGSLDSSFGSKGTTVTRVGSYDSYITDIALQSNGKIVALGSTDNYTASANTRYNVDGSLDTTFANDGIAHNFFPGIYGSAVSLLIQDDNKILLGGGVYMEKGLYALERLTVNGLIDSSFGVNGETTTDFADYSSGITSIRLQTSGKIVAIGGSSTVNYYHIVSLARYNNDGSHKQILITKIRRWLQHHNGIVWYDLPGIKSYAVQRSAGGFRWATVHRQQATANSQSSVVNSSQSTVNYYNDASPLPGTNYYRLQTTSVDGAVAYSNVITINNEPSTISISPNPAKNVLHIEGLSPSNKTKITVVDLNGNVACTVQLSANSSSYNINIAALKPGNYWLKLEVNGEVVTKQFVKE